MLQYRCQEILGTRSWRGKVNGAAEHSKTIND